MSHGNGSSSGDGAAESAGLSSFRILMTPEEPEFREDQARMRSGVEFGPGSPKLGPLTAVLLGISVVVALLSRLGKDDELLAKLYITQYGFDSRGHIPPEVGQGQVWRLLTPIFIHFGVAHLVFNMLWLKDLGTMIEKLVSTRLLLALVLVIGVLSNVAQFAVSGPFFGGMSGVVYGLLGYVWMKSRFDPASGLFLQKQTVVMMIVWFFLCLSGVIGNVANAAHGAGLVTGMCWGFASAKTRSA